VLEALLVGREPATAVPLGNPLIDRTLADGRVIRAVAGVRCHLSAPKSVSVWWALTGDLGKLDTHDVAVGVALEWPTGSPGLRRVVDGHLPSDHVAAG
jgi:hypothetical protein